MSIKQNINSDIDHMTRRYTEIMTEVGKDHHDPEAFFEALADFFLKTHVDVEVEIVNDFPATAAFSATRWYAKKCRSCKGTGRGRNRSLKSAFGRDHSIPCSECNSTGRSMQPEDIEIVVPFPAHLDDIRPEHEVRLKF